MITLIHIEPGMVVAGRYVVSTIDRPWIEEAPEAGAVCTALDAILDEPVLIHVADAEKSGDMLDAARRVSILGDHRIAPTLDVGQANGLDYVVVERIAAAPLGEIIPRTPMSLDAARALIGEIGTVLVAAARRGLFHMFLRPSTVGITSKGSVLVSGIGIDTALALGTGVIQAEDWTPTKASRQDALDLVRLFYAALTGYWPGDEAVSGIPPSGRENSRIARASSLNPALPTTVDDFVTGILTGVDPGPGSVAEVLGYLAEWDPQILRYVSTAPVRENENLFNQAPRSFDEATRLPTPRSKSIGEVGSQATASEDQVKAALVRIGITRPGTRGLAAGVVGRTTGRYADRMQMREASSFPVGASQIDNAAQEWDEWEPEQTYSDYSGYADREYDDNMTTPIMNRDAQDPNDPDTQALDIVAEDDDNDTRVIMDDEDDGSWFLGGMFETYEQQREHQLREYERERRIARAKEEEARRRIAALEAASAGKRAETAHTPPKQVRRLSPGDIDDVSTAPMSPQAPVTNRTAAGSQASTQGASTQPVSTQGAAEQQSGDTRPRVAAAVGAAGVGATAVGVGAAATGATPAGAGPGGTGAAPGAAGTGTRGPGPDSDASERRKKPFLWILLAVILVAALVIGIVVFNQNSGDDSGTVADSPSPAQPADQETEQPAEEPQAAPPEIDKVSALDPEGDNSENDGNADKVVPGEKGSWRTDRYNSADFGNLKSGLGLHFELKDKTTVKEVEVKSSSSGGAFEIRDGSDPEDAKKVGEGEFDKDGVTVELDDGVETENLILWITKLPKGEGGYRASISTVEFK
ncbi:virulence factor MviN [Brevibacterium sp.]|uniref:virulence factor MviN n=1 Tax=Brevibacterium sp. TaxID=1701 RepID=UPI002811721E|nr:virulence factor MviN [Brevibacterium sp.]